MGVGGSCLTADGSRLNRQLLYRNVQRFRGGLVFKAHRLLYHSSLGSRVMKKKKRARKLQSALKLSSERGTCEAVGKHSDDLGT